MTIDQLKYLQVKLRDAWIRVLDAEQTARQYIPATTWRYSTHSCYFEEEQHRIYQCLIIVNRQLTDQNYVTSTGGY